MLGRLLGWETLLRLLQKTAPVAGVVKSMGYTVGRCIYSCRTVRGIVCVRHNQLVRRDPLVPRPETVKGSEK